MSSSHVLSANSYGKARVRVLKLKHGSQDDFTDINVRCLLSGDGLDKAYFTEDNSRIVPTDTVRQTIYILANQHPIDPIEDFGVTVGKHFLEMYSWINQVDVNIEQLDWQRLKLAAGPSKQGFVKGGSHKRFAVVTVTRTSVKVRGGISGLVLLKTGGSGFVGFNKCRNTALPEVKERMMVSAVDLSWVYAKAPHCYNGAFAAAQQAVFERFQDHYSPSVQFTLYRIGQGVLDAVKEMEEVSLAMPNIHHIPYDVSRFGVKHTGDVLLPTEEPQGHITGTIKRAQAARL